MKRKFRRKNYIVEAEQMPDGLWRVSDNGTMHTMDDAYFQNVFEEVSALHRVHPLRIEAVRADAEGSD